MKPSLPPGAVVAGKLRVIRELGAGGMGTVYEVEHELTKHRRALKILHAQAVQDGAAVARFQREAAAAGRIGNAHIAETFDAGRLDTGEPYLLMELLDGETLDALLKRSGPIDPAELAELGVQACDGVQAAHEAGIVHRDLKPENLFVTRTNSAPFVKVLDFGISKFDESRTGEGAKSHAVTREGAILGTPYYMPPEQVRGEAAIDARADVYALGVILYECACGRRPYDAPALEALAVLIHEGKAEPLQARNPALPAAFCAAVHRAMAADRDARFGSARELAAALDPFRRRRSTRPADADALAATVATEPAPDEDHDVDPVGVRRTTRAMAGLALAAVAAGAVVWVSRHRDAPAPVTIETARSPDIGPSDARPLPPPAPPPPVPAEATSAASSVAASAPPHPLHHPAAPPSAVPDAAPPPKTRADQTGLAGENPFR
jgi:serine/threonine-protein kinase